MQKGKEEKKNKPIEITYFTDPLCCWSWAFEPQWRRLRFEYADKISWKYRMGGLLANWNIFNDSLNCISKPSQMGPLWMEAQEVSGMTLQDKIWINDPPSSSYPSCIAVKCAELQSQETAEVFLRCLREAVMIKGKNISKKEIILEVARQLSDENSKLFNYDSFANNFLEEQTLNTFREDLQFIRYHNISRFPTLIIKANNKTIAITGYKPYTSLLEILASLNLDFVLQENFIDLNTYKNFWKKITDRELEEIEKSSVKNKQVV